MTVIAVDCTELYRNPIRTGIQRVVRELLRHWPSDAPETRVVRFVAGGGLVRLPPLAVRLLTDEEPGAAELSPTELARQLSDAASASATAPLPEEATLFVPEVFYDHSRCAFYEARLEAGKAPVALLAYDFLPYLRPELFGVRTVAPLMRYLRLARSARHVGYISQRTKEDHLTRVQRGRAASCGPVLALGADGLELKRQAWAPSRRGFVALGSLDGRKNQHLIVEAFAQLWRAGRDAPLTLVGRAFENADLRWLEQAKRFPGFRWLNNATDAEVVRVLSEARATIYVSETEGFGLPPVESLGAGIPVIVSSSIPSVAMLSPAGQIRLENTAPATIADAVLRLMEDDAAAALWRDASTVRLGSWRDFAAEAATWIQGLSAAA